MKKTVAFVLSGLLLSSGSANALSMSNDYYYDAPAYVMPAPLKKVLGLEFRINGLLEKISKSELSKIKDLKLRAYYSNQLKERKDGVKSVFRNSKSNAKWGMSDVEATKDALKIGLRSFNETVTEMRSAPVISDVSAAEKADVENRVLSLQRALVVNPMRPLLEKFDKGGIKETGDWKGSFDSPMGKVNASMEKYTSILSMVGLSQEADFVFASDFDLNLPGKNSYDEETYEMIKGSPIGLKGSAKFDVNFKIIDEKAYVLVRSYSLDAAISGSGTTSDSKELSTGLTKARLMLDGIKGKTLSFDIPKDDMNSNPEVVLSKVKEFFSILDSSSLFTASRKTGDSKYLLAANAKTMLKIGDLFEDRPTNKELKKMNKELSKLNLSLEVKDGQSVISASGDTGSMMSFLLKTTSTGHSFRLETVGNRERLIMTATENSAGMTFKSGSDEGMATWDGKNLSAAIGKNGEFATVSGTLTADSADLGFTIMKQPVGTLTVKKNGDVYESAINLSFEVPKGFGADGKYSISSVKRSKIETGDFKIEVPVGAIDAETLLK